jgi:hypothetical protein
MNRRALVIITVLSLISCAGASGSGESGGGESFGLKGDGGDLTEVEWANQFFLTQVHDSVWNPGGMSVDTDSNNCGPASLAMLLAARGETPPGLDPETAIDHARATMYPDYPDIDAGGLPEGAAILEEGGLVLVDDDSHPVYFDWMDVEASVPQGIANGGGEPVFGYSFGELDDLLSAHGAAIVHGHITEDWPQRFSGDYADVSAGAVPHFILLYRASVVGEYIVCDPMHLGGAERMTVSALQTFFKSPVNVYETTLRAVAWEGAVDAGPEGQHDEPHEPGLD